VKARQLASARLQRVRVRRHPLLSHVCNTNACTLLSLQQKRCPLTHHQGNTMPPRRSPARSSSSGGGASAASASAAPAGGGTSKPYARSGSHPKPPSALEMALDTFLDASTPDNQAALKKAAQAAPTELVTPEHIQRLVAMLREPSTAWDTLAGLSWLAVKLTDRQIQFGGEGLMM